jgi:hypothetical protein
MADNLQYAMQWLMRRGYQPHQAAALVGHGFAESGMQPTGVVGDNGTAKGAFQWRGDRLAGLYNFANQTGADPNHLDTQLGFLDHELNTTERRAGDALRAAPDVRSAVRAGMMYERPQGFTMANPEGGMHWSKRLGKAEEMLGMPRSAVQAAAPAAAGAAPVMQAGPPMMPGAPGSMGDIAAALMLQNERSAQRRADLAAAEQERQQALLGSSLFG